MPDLKTLQAEIEKLQNRILELEKVKADLTAQNGTPFKFGVNSSSEYGYMLNGVLLPFGKKETNAAYITTVCDYDTTVSVDVKTALPTEIYENLNANNFILYVNPAFEGNKGFSESTYVAVGLKGAKITGYNSSTGVLSVYTGCFYYDSANNSLDWKNNIGSIKVYAIWGLE